MKAHLMHLQRDFDADQPLPVQADDLVVDLGLTTVVDAMAEGDQFLHDVARSALLGPLESPDEVRYRQAILRDCLDQPELVRGLYEIATQAIDEERKIFGSIFRSPETVLHRALDVLELFVGALRRVRTQVSSRRGSFRSEGLIGFARMLETELGDDYFAELEDHLRRLHFREGVLLSVRLGEGNRGTGYVLRRSPETKLSVWERITPWNHGSGLTYRLADRDESGFRALGELRDVGLNLVANAAAQSADHMLGLFRRLRAETGFYVGCLNLHERLVASGAPASLPVPEPTAARALSCRGLQDAGLVLSTSRPAVGNDLDADGATLVAVTGANQGGKSTFLRSLGLAQLMMQSGMFVTADSFNSSVCLGIFTHYRREEDSSMSRGKLDDELSRMSAVVDGLRPGSLLLCNESLSSTNEREGSQIAREIVRALREAGVRVVYVTHLFDLAHEWFRDARDDSVFLRAEREEDGRRTFRLVVGEPLSTSFGEDLYRRIFEAGQAGGPQRAAGGGQAVSSALAGPADDQASKR
jgi:hypothetical protein